MATTTVFYFLFLLNKPIFPALFPAEVRPSECMGNFEEHLLACFSSYHPTNTVKEIAVSTSLTVFVG